MRRFKKYKIFVEDEKFLMKIFNELHDDNYIKQVGIEVDKYIGNKEDSYYFYDLTKKGRLFINEYDSNLSSFKEKLNIWKYGLIIGLLYTIGDIILRFLGY